MLALCIPMKTILILAITIFSPLLAQAEGDNIELNNCMAQIEHPPGNGWYQESTKFEIGMSCMHLARNIDECATIRNPLSWIASSLKSQIIFACIEKFGAEAGLESCNQVAGLTFSPANKKVFRAVCNTLSENKLKSVKRDSIPEQTADNILPAATEVPAN